MSSLLFEKSLSTKQFGDITIDEKGKVNNVGPDGELQVFDPSQIGLEKPSEFALITDPKWRSKNSISIVFVEYKKKPYSDTLYPVYSLCFYSIKDKKYDIILNGFVDYSFDPINKVLNTTIVDPQTGYCLRQQIHGTGRINSWFNVNEACYSAPGGFSQHDNDRISESFSMDNEKSYELLSTMNSKPSSFSLTTPRCFGVNGTVISHPGSNVFRRISHAQVIVVKELPMKARIGFEKKATATNKLNTQVSQEKAFEQFMAQTNEPTSYALLGRSNNPFVEQDNSKKLELRMGKGINLGLGKGNLKLD